MSNSPRIAESISNERLADCLAVLEAVDLGDKVLSVEPVTGGLFNFLLKIETREGAFFFKQYLDKAPNPTFKPPEIPASQRSRLAYDVQREAILATKATSPWVPEIVHFDEGRSAFLMRSAGNGTPLIDLLSKGIIPSSSVIEVPQALALLHERTYGRFFPTSAPLFANRVFRDFKLRLQYDDIADGLLPSEAIIVRELREEYQERTVCMTHGDPNSRNILINEAKPFGLIDFEQSHLGGPEYDVSYILCELWISAMSFGSRSEHIAALTRFLDEYFKTFARESREKVEIDIGRHLAVQAIYRFWGPSKNSWTFYIEETDRDYIIEMARRALAKNAEPVSQWIAEV